MAGLLDFIQTPEGQGLLSAAFGGLAGARRDAPLNSIGRAGVAGLGGYAGAQERQQQLAEGVIKQKYMNSQIAENETQNQLRQAQLAQQQRRDAYYMGGDTPSPGGLLSDAPQMPAGASAPSLGGMGPVTPAPLSLGVAPDPKPAAAPAAPGATGDKFSVWSQQYGIPRDALMADYMNNGGKGIAEMLAKRGTPDMQVSNGYVYNKNEIRPGYLPSLTTSQDGKTSMVRIGPDGLPVVSAPSGALTTYNGYKRADAALEPMKVYNPKTGVDEYTTKSAVVDAAGGLPIDATTPGTFASAYPGVNPMKSQPGESDKPAIYAQALQQAQSQLASAKTRDESRRAESDIAGIRNEMFKLGISPAQSAPSSSGRMAAGPSLIEAAANKGREATASSIGGQAGTLLKESADQANGAVQAVQSAQRMQQALDSDSVLSGPGASLRLKGLQIASTLGIPGKNDAEKIANTRQAVQEMAKLTLAGRKQMSGQGAITNQESALAERATSGDIDSLTAPEIRQLAQAAERTGRFQYAQHEAKMTAMGNDPTMAGNVALYRAAPMPEAAAKPVGVVATMRFNPSTGKLEKVK